MHLKTSSLFDSKRRQAIRTAVAGEKDLKALLRGSKKGPEPPMRPALREKLSKEEQERLNDGLIEAARNGRIELVRELIEKGGDVDAKNDKGETPLIAASYTGHENVVELLLQIGADANAGTTYRFFDKNLKIDAAILTALNYAFANGHLKIVELLRKHGAI